MGAIAGKFGAVYMAQGSPIAMTDEATTCLDPGAYTKYQIADAAKRYVDKDTPVTVKVNGVEQSSGWTFDYVGGIVTFDTPLTSADVVTVSGAYLQVSQVGGFFDWEVEISVDNADATEFGDEWRKSQPIVKGFSGRAERWWADEAFLNSLGQEKLIVLYVDENSGYRYEGYALFETDRVNVPVDTLIDEPITFQGDGQLYYRSG